MPLPVFSMLSVSNTGMPDAGNLNKASRRPLKPVIILALVTALTGSTAHGCCLLPLLNPLNWGCGWHNWTMGHPMSPFGMGMMHCGNPTCGPYGYAYSPAYSGYSWPQPAVMPSIYQPVTPNYSAPCDCNSAAPGYEAAAVPAAWQSGGFYAGTLPTGSNGLNMVSQPIAGSYAPPYYHQPHARPGYPAAFRTPRPYAAAVTPATIAARLPQAMPSAPMSAWGQPSTSGWQGYSATTAMSPLSGDLYGDHEVAVTPAPVPYTPMSYYRTPQMNPYQPMGYQPRPTVQIGSQRRYTHVIR